MKIRNAVALAAIVVILATAFLFLFRLESRSQNSSHDEELRTTPLETEISQKEPVYDLNSEPHVVDTKVEPAKETAEGQPQQQDKLLLKVESNLQQNMIAEGFSQHEADSAVNELLAEFKKREESIAVADVVDRLVNTLKLDNEQKKKLNGAVIRSIGDSTQITFDQWNQCLNYRIKGKPICIQDIALDLSRSIAAINSSQEIKGHDWQKSVEVSKEFMVEAVKRCNISEDEAEQLFRIILSGCP